MNPDWRTRGQVHDRGVADQPPYWRDAANVVRYPWLGSNGMVIGVLSMIASVQIVPVIGTFASLFLLLAVPKHALEVLRDSAHGHREPPQFGLDVGDRAVFAFLALLLAFAVVHLALTMFAPGPWPAAWRLLMATVLPLIAMSLAIDENIGRAINPVYWAEVLARVGLPYLGAIVLVWLGLGFGLTGAAWLDRVLPPFFGAMVSTAIALWVLFMAAHVCGRLVFQYRDALGFTPSGPEEPEKLRFSRDHRLEDRITAMLAEGKAAEARTALEEELRERAVSAALHRQYRSLLRDARDNPALLAHGRQWLHQKIVEGDARGALSLVQECLDLDPSFTPLDVEDWPPVIAAAERAGLQRLADAARSAQGPRPPAQSGSSS
ncbi:hypothetical protein [Silanimonas sp.]|uniref:hypothetical protein n=1 Tax=Silanimonas sp. TaxID=1929290 RepID=UPI0022C985BA|nr:hypothetical protein [Silanimonas sp.]MCZ8165281.1 hypothetical protein [Silanimonas sp.]